MTIKSPLIVGIGGSVRSPSSSEVALRIALSAAEAAGATTRILTGAELLMPMFDPGSNTLDAKAATLVAALREADGLIIASPGYHGSVSGLLKNALDYAEMLRPDRRAYLEQRAVGCIVCAAGWQATGSTLMALRNIVHALRGWPTPLGVTINSAQATFSDSGQCSDPVVSAQLAALGEQVVQFARRWSETAGC